MKHRLYVAGDWALTLMFGRYVDRREQGGVLTGWLAVEHRRRRKN